MPLCTFCINDAERSPFETRTGLSLRPGEVCSRCGITADGEEAETAHHVVMNDE